MNDLINKEHVNITRTDWYYIGGILSFYSAHVVACRKHIGSTYARCQTATGRLICRREANMANTRLYDLCM